MTNGITTAIEEIIEEAAKMKNAYFWEPPIKAADRRWYEEKHSHEKIEWDEGGHHYSAAYTVSCSCKNIYASGYYEKDGKKTTLTAIKNSCKRMQAIAG